MKKKFKIPVIWEMSGFVNIEANTLEEAIELFDKIEDEEGNETPIGNYIEGSFNRESLEIAEIYNK